MVERRVPALASAAVASGLWCWVALRLVLAPADVGPLESAVAVGGWGLSLLPVHVVAVPAAVSSRRAAAAEPDGGTGAGDGVS
ncbi:hypothetical protein [Streptomyces sp. NBC_00344]|uniref:hypothetical protein n=1 Tax=Streptomyces sp. NBC_00344 TaxID=2975720 RepID=UPI002E1BF84C